MIRPAQSPDLQAAFAKYLTETEVQVERLQQVFKLIGKRAQAKTCPTSPAKRKPVKVCRKSRPYQLNFYGLTSTAFDR